MSLLTESAPWLARYYTLALRPSPRPPTLNACYLQVITPVSPRRQLVVFDGQHTASAILSHAAANVLDADEDNLGVTTQNLCGYLIAPVSVLVVPDISSASPQATLVITELRVFADRWGGDPVGNPAKVDTVPNVLVVLRAWVGRKMASFITRGKLERGDPTGELGVGEDGDEEVRGMPTVDVVQLGELLREEEERSARYADTVKVLDRHVHDDGAAEASGGRPGQAPRFAAGGSGPAVKMVHVGTGEGTDSRGASGARDSDDAEWEMNFRAPALDVDADVDMEDTADGGEPLPQTQRFDSEDGDEDDVVNATKKPPSEGGDVRNEVVITGDGGAARNLNAMVDQYWAKDPLCDRSDRANFNASGNAKNIENSLSVVQKGDDNTSVCKGQGATQKESSGKDTKQVAIPVRKGPLVHMENDASHMGNNMTSETQENPVQTDPTPQNPAPVTHQPEESHADKETSGERLDAEEGRAITPGKEAEQVEQSPQPKEAARAEIDGAKAEGTGNKDAPQSNDPVPSADVGVGLKEETKEQSGEPTEASGAAQEKISEEAPKEAVALTLESTAQVTTEVQVQVTTEKILEENTDKDAGSDTPQRAAVTEPASEQHPDSMDVDTAPPHLSAEDKEPGRTGPAPEARDVRIVEDLAVVDEVEPIAKGGTKRKETDGAVDSEKRKVQRDASEPPVQPAVQPAVGPLERLKRELELMRQFRRAVDRDPDGYVLMPDAFLPSLSDAKKQARRKENGISFPSPDVPVAHKGGDEDGVANVPDSAPI